MANAEDIDTLRELNRNWGRYTDVWQLRQGRWLCISANVSRG